MNHPCLYCSGYAELFVSSFSYTLLTKMKEVQSVSALHSSDKVVDWEDKRNACPVALGTD